MRDGYIKLWRKSIDSPLWKNHDLWRFWQYCLLKASHKERLEMVGYQEVPLSPGEFVFGRRIASEETGLSERCIRTCLKNLKNYGNLTIKVTNKFSIISIVKWNEYQGEVTNNVTSKRPASDQQVTTNKNDKNVKKDKEVYIDYQGIVNLFNDICKSLPKVKELNNKRKSVIKSRWNGSIDTFKEVFELVEDSDFLSGRNGKWSNCSFDWVMKEDNFIKIKEGTYGNERGRATQTTVQRVYTTPEEHYGRPEKY